jgi:hypothetical protein
VARVARAARPEGSADRPGRLDGDPSKEKLADKLAKSIHEDIATVVFRARQKATSSFTGITPRLSFDPIDGSLSFTFEASSRKEDIDATLEKLSNFAASPTSAAN